MPDVLICCGHEETHQSEQGPFPHRAGAVAAAASVGLVVGTAVPAEAAIIHYVSSSWVEAYAGATSSTGRDGMIQGYALLGNDFKWGARSSSSTLAKVNGFNLTHKAQLFRDGKLIVST